MTRVERNDRGEWYDRREWYERVLFGVTGGRLWNGSWDGSWNDAWDGSGNGSVEGLADGSGNVLKKLKFLFLRVVSYLYFNDLFVKFANFCGRVIGLLDWSDSGSDAKMLTGCFLPLH